MSVLTRPAATPAPTIRAPAVLWFDDTAATDRALVGAKAANLATARRRRLEVLDGFVITAPGVHRTPGSPPPPARTAWDRLSGGGTTPLVVRSSARNEDLATSSMAGRYTSVLDVRGWEAFCEAYRAVVDSAGGEDIAVLVQRFVRPTVSGVLFGCDPVSGRRDRMVIAAVEGGPDALVSGAVEGRRLVVDRAGFVHGADGDPGPVLRRSDRLRLLALERRLRATFGGPQDVEWAIADGRLTVLQSRPITTVAGTGEGPLLGPGPVAETFPRPLTVLEQELWVPPLRRAATEVLTITGAVSRRRLQRSRVITVVDSQVVADLEVFGAARERRGALRALDPRPNLRRLSVAWRVGRLRGAIGNLSAAVIEDVDRQLRGVGHPSAAGDEELLTILENCRAYLCSIHGHEMLAATLSDDDGASGAEVALASIAEGQALGCTDDGIIARAPAALAVTAPSLGPRAPLPDVAPADRPAPGPLRLREELRLRVRWIHELSRVVVRELGARLHARGQLADREHVAHLSRAELAAAVRGAPVDPVVPRAVPTPVPARFRLTADGLLASEDDRGGAGGAGGVGAGGGRGSGPVAFDAPVPGDVLVVRTLDPELAPLLPHLAGIVAETGSPLSHLAILARERGIPVVVGHPTIRAMVEPGTVVVIDGRTGAVDVVGESGGP